MDELKIAAGAMGKTKTNGSRAFTMIEMLGIIVVIALLAGLLLPVISAARQRAKMAQAKTDIKAIEAAIQAYYNEYGKLPVPDAEQGTDCDDYYGMGLGGTWGDNGLNQYEIIQILRAIPDPSTIYSEYGSYACNPNNKYNPRQIVFLQLPDRPNALGPDWKTFLDPWGRCYYIKLDNNYNNIIAYPGTACPETSGYRMLALIISYGPNSTQQDPNQPGCNNVFNFQ